jgi:hypothetical protein
MNGGLTTGNDGGALLFAAPENFTAPNADCPTVHASDLPIPGRPGMNPSYHGSDEQMFGAAQQVLHGRRGD